MQDLPIQSAIVTPKAGSIVELDDIEANVRLFSFPFCIVCVFRCLFFLICVPSILTLSYFDFDNAYVMFLGLADKVCPFTAMQPMLLRVIIPYYHISTFVPDRSKALHGVAVVEVLSGCSVRSSLKTHFHDDFEFLHAFGLFFYSDRSKSARWRGFMKDSGIHEDSDMWHIIFTNMRMILCVARYRSCRCIDWWRQYLGHSGASGWEGSTLQSSMGLDFLGSFSYLEQIHWRYQQIGSCKGQTGQVFFLEKKVASQDLY